MWSESYDRLWQAHLIEDVGLPELRWPRSGRLVRNPRRRRAFCSRSPSPSRSAAGSPTCRASRAARSDAVPARRGDRRGSLVFALAGLLWLALLGSYALFVARSVAGPIFSAWLNRSIQESSVRATVISITNQADAVGQWTGGPAWEPSATCWDPRGARGRRRLHAARARALRPRDPPPGRRAGARDASCSRMSARAARSSAPATTASATGTSPGRPDRGRSRGSLRRRAGGALEAGRASSTSAAGRGPPPRLAERFNVLGVDISTSSSSAPARGAGRHVRAGRHRRGRLSGRSLDAVVALYSVTHVPARPMPSCSADRSLAAAGGLFLARSARAAARTGSASGSGRDVLLELGRGHQSRAPDAGFELARRGRTMREPEGPATFLWALASSGHDG